MERESRMVASLSNRKDGASTNQFHTIFVSNISLSWKRRDLRNLFQAFAKVIDFFIPNKKTMTGLKFGFV